jgi:hypothetical protein
LVKLGFITEGATEKMILESADFRNLLSELRIDFIPEVIDVVGNGNLLPHNIEKHSQILFNKGATKIIILTDLDHDVCITRTKQRIQPLENHIVVVSIKQIESWFLSDSSAMRNFLRTANFDNSNPELHSNPYEEIKNMRIAKINQGLGSKIFLASIMIKHNGFSVRNAAEHPNCISAKYFLDKIKQLAFA